VKKGKKEWNFRNPQEMVSKAQQQKGIPGGQESMSRGSWRMVKKALKKDPDDDAAARCAIWVHGECECIAAIRKAPNGSVYASKKGNVC
jgi:hypothetical protein